MGDDPYRDELEAAHQRIAALEAELARARTGPVSDEFAPHLLPGEEVRWLGAPDARRAAFKPRRLWFMAALAFVTFWVVVGMMRGMPPAISLLAGSMLAASGVFVGARTVQALRDASASRYAITDRRLLLLKQADGEVTVRGIPLTQELTSSLTLRGEGLGDLTITLPGGEAVGLTQIPGAARAHKLLEQCADDRSEPV